MKGFAIAAAILHTITCVLFGGATIKDMINMVKSKQLLEVKLDSTFYIMLTFLVSFLVVDIYLWLEVFL